MPFRLRYGAHDVELPVGEFVIGRAEECQLALDDPLVSRRHVALRVTATDVTLVDLGSRNGVSVNGQKVKVEQRLADADKVQIGNHELVFETGKRQDRPRRKASTATLGAIDITSIRAQMPPRPETTQMGTPTAGVQKLANSLGMLGQLADKALAMGRAEEAERLLAPVLGDLLKELRGGRLLDPATQDRAASYAVKVAASAGKAVWIDWIFEVFLLSERLIPTPTVDELYAAVRRVKGVDLTLLIEYVDTIRALAPSFSPNERFAMQRIEGLKYQLSAPG